MTNLIKIKLNDQFNIFNKLTTNLGLHDVFCKTKIIYLFIYLLMGLY